MLEVTDREGVVGIARILRLGTGVVEIVLALGREGTTEPVGRSA